ncbi:MAG: FtsK/SpoIIIE domain-containing protein, partial [Neisseriaceae bacterium]|nr:FtsK/SpoIIIE domain-containing protein [Neisseriaceae bacterium]
LGMKATMASLIARYTSKHLKMILMGKNEKDFDSYVNLPHLIAPFVNNPDSALNTFNWCLDESKKRLQILHDTKCNDINELNQKIYSAFEKNIFIADPFSEDLDNPSPLKPLPFLVVFIDELDWLQSTLQQIDKQLFLDLVQYSKEIGIHLVLTQSSPSVHSLTPTLKYIFPTRLAFKVDSHVESLLILNQLGAEKLIVKGDALLLLPDHRQTIRLQIGTLNQKEYSQLVSNFQSKQTFDDNIINYQPKQTNTTPENQDLYDMAVQHVLNSQKTSISFLQRKMKIGYNLANQLLEQMEMNGILSKAELGGKREILIHSNKQQAKGKKWH